MKKRLLALVLAAVMGLMTACGGGTSSTAAPAASGEAGNSAGTAAPAGDTSAILGQTSEVSNLNPLVQPRAVDSNATCMIFGCLVIPDEEINYVGDLAENWDVSEDGCTYTFHLKKDVKWHDGEPFTANDVAFTYTSLAAPTYTGGCESRVLDVVGAAAYQAGEADAIEGIQVIDDHTIAFTLNEPNAAFIGNCYTCILPEHLLKDVDPADWATCDFNRSPVGTGKYKFVKWESDQYIEMEANPDYYGEAPKIGHVFLRFGDETTLTAALINGEIDALYNMSASELETLEAMDGVHAELYDQMTVYYIGLNLNVDSLSDLRVRQALSYGIDKQAIVNTVYGETGFVTDSIFPANNWTYSDDVTKYPYDPEKAKSLLEEAGYTMNASTGYFEKDGKTLHLTYDLVTGVDGNQVAALVQQQWKAIGVEMEVIEQDFSTLAFTKLFPSDDAGQPRFTTAEDFQCYTLGFGQEADPDEYRPYLSTATEPGSWNFVDYSNEKVDELFQKQLTATNQEERAAAYHEIGKIISEDIPWIPLYGKKTIAGVSDKIEGFAADYRGFTFQIEKWSKVA